MKKENMTTDNNKKKSGFTLVELMAIIAVLSLIIIVIVGIFNSVIDSSEEKMDEVTKNLIITAAESYALEYRGEDSWNEEIDGLGNISFCVSLDSLIDYGYFTNSGTNFEDYRGKYAVRFDIVNGVTNSSFIDLEEVNNGVCRYYIEDSNVLNSDNDSSKIDVTVDSGDKIGYFDYRVNKIDSNKYDLDVDLNIMNVSSSVEAGPINVLFIVDRSSSMVVDYIDDEEYYYNPQKYENVKNAVINFSKRLLTNTSDGDALSPYSKIALVMFDEFATVNRNFLNKIISNNNFSDVGQGTNIADGIDMAISLLYNNSLNNTFSQEDLDNTYVILLSDGDTSAYSYMYDGKNYINSSFLYKKYGNYNIKNNTLANNFYSNIYREQYKYISFDVDYDSYFNNVLPELKDSSNYLKNLGAKFFIIEYNYSNYVDQIKMMTTQDNNLCVSGNTFKSYSKNGKNYCYYESENKNTINDLFEVLLQNIVEYNSMFDKINLVIEPSFDSSNDSLVTFVKDDVEIGDNKIVETISFADIGENKEINLEQLYSFKLNSVLYDMCSLNHDDSNQCKLDSVNLFNVYIEITYTDGSFARIPIDVPKFEISISMVDKLN